MEIALKNLQKKVKLNPPRILRTVKTILRHEGIEKAALSIVFVSSQRIKALNKKYLGREYATDVLAFDFSERRGTARRAPASGSDKLAGDIIISTDAAVKNAKVYNTASSQELALYIIHGILHLLRYDDHKPKDAQKMRRKEQEILTALGAEVKGIVK